MRESRSLWLGHHSLVFLGSIGKQAEQVMRNKSVIIFSVSAPASKIPATVEFLLGIPSVVCDSGYVNQNKSFPWAQCFIAVMVKVTKIVSFHTLFLELLTLG